PDDRAVLKVPFVTQHQNLCAAAAPAMVLRYWGRTDATPDHFTALLRCTARGLEPDALTAALHGRGWRTDVRRNQDSTIEQLRDEVHRGYPVIALVGDRPDLNHYVVVIATTADEVIVQDPLRGPYEVLETADF